MCNLSQFALTNASQTTDISGILLNISNLLDNPLISQKKYFLSVATGLPQIPNLSMWKGLQVHDKKVNGQLSLWAYYLGQSAVAPVRNSAYELDWLFSPKVSVTLCDRVLARLVQLEAHEVNLHLKADYRQAFICLTLANRGNTEPFTVASYTVHGCHPDKVWPMILANRQSRLGREYPDFYDAAGNLRPDVPKKDSAATQTLMSADTVADHPQLPASARSATVPPFKKAGTA